MCQTKVVERVKTHVLENRAVYNNNWENSVERGMPQMAMWRMRISCCIPKATNTNSECVIRIAFPTAAVVA